VAPRKHSFVLWVASVPGVVGDVLSGRQEHSALAWEARLSEKTRLLSGFNIPFDWLNLVKHNRGEKRGLQADMCLVDQ